MKKLLSVKNVPKDVTKKGVNLTLNVSNVLIKPWILNKLVPNPFPVKTKNVKPVPKNKTKKENVPSVMPMKH